MQRPTRKIPFSPPDISEAEIQEVAETLRSGWITTGPRTKQLERELTCRLDWYRKVRLSEFTDRLCRNGAAFAWYWQRR